VPPADPHGQRVFARILWGIGLGILAGLFFGESIKPLTIVSAGFIRLLQVNVLPYMLGSLIASLGSRESNEMKVIAKSGTAFLLLVWGLGLLLVVLSPLAFPDFSGAPVFGVDEPAAPIDWLDLYIPSNLFHALTNNLIPAVVLFGILAGVALGQIPDERKALLLQALETFNDAMARVSRMILRLTPYGLFAIAAVTAGQIRGDDLMRLQVWFAYYAGGALLLTLWVLPSLVSRFTPVPYGRFLGAMRNAIVTAAAAGDVLVVLPLIAESAKELLVESGVESGPAERAVGVAVPLLYNFPHVGKILSLAFVPFAAWFAGSSLRLGQLALVATAGPLSMFGSINAAMPFLLNLTRLPTDLFELFTISSIVNTRFGAMTAAAHTAALSVLVAAAMLHEFTISARRLIRFVLMTSALFAAFIVGTRAVFTWWLPPAPSGLEALAPFALRPPLVQAAMVPVPTGNLPHEPGRRLQEIKQHRLMRVGYFPDSVPWAFVNAKGEVVGFDIEAAHRLANQLDVRLEFVAISRVPPIPSVELAAGHIDVIMTGMIATVGRAERMDLSHPYAQEHLGFLVHDFDRGKFDSLAEMNGGQGLVIAVPKIDNAAAALKRLLPQAEIREYEVFDDVVKNWDVTGIVTSMERAYYWSRIRPELAAVRPDGLNVGSVLVYAVPSGERELQDVINLWIEMRKASGDEDEAYSYWIRGNALTPRAPRWSILRNVFGWK
jgi:Na+/H+-dicarboxylate symporter/ABC-type amino acid transport substrate-binding protein